MEAVIAGLVKPGHNALVVDNGYFAERIIDCIQKYGGNATPLKLNWGTPVSEEQLCLELGKKDYDLVFVVHAETSTGMLQGNMKKLGEEAHGHGALFIADMVTSLGGLPVQTLYNDVDAAWSGNQKNINGPTGISPVVFRQRALDSLNPSSETKSWYFDPDKLRKYWKEGGGARSYHHTAMGPLLFGLDAALDIVLEEGIEARARRLFENAELLQTGLENLGFSYVVINPQDRLPNLHAVRVPEGINEATLRTKLLDEHNIEIGGGLGEFAGKIVRIGIMGQYSSPERVRLLLDTIAQELPNSRAA